jgi:hypothetical protein
MTGLKGNPVQVRNSTRCCNPALAARLMKWFADNVTVPLTSGWEGRQNPGKVRRPAAISLKLRDKAIPILKHTLVPSAGTCRLRALSVKRISRLFQALLKRFESFIHRFLFRPKNAPPAGSGDCYLLFGDPYSLLLFQLELVLTLQGRNCFDYIHCERSAFNEKYSFAGNTLTSFPSWRQN